MTVYDLNRDQLLELKQRYMCEEYDERGKTPSYGELMDADEIYSDDFIYKVYEGCNFVPDDFSSSEEEDEEYSFGVDLSGTPEYIAEQLRLIAGDIESGYYSGLAGGYGASWGLEKL